MSPPVHPPHQGDLPLSPEELLALDAMRSALAWFIENPEPHAVPMLVAVEDFTLTLDDGTVETFKRGRDRIVADHDLVALAGEHRFRPVSAAEDGTAAMTLGQIAYEDPDLARRVLEQRDVSMRAHRTNRTLKGCAPDSRRPVARPRRRGAGRPRATASRSSARSGDSGDDGPGEPPASPLRLALTRAVLTFGCLPAEQRGEAVS